MPTARQAASATGRAILAAWLVLGACFVLLLVIELGFRIGNVVTGADVSVQPIPPSYQKLAWWPEYVREYDDTRPDRWESYVYFGRVPGFHGQYINIDANGHRATARPGTSAPPTAKVFVFGGSTIWGDDQRDDHTIASEISRRLQPLAPAGGRVAVTNFGESGYVSTQELLQLLLQLRAGNVPDVVVFVDGINDVYATVQDGAPGIPQNESKRAAEFGMGRQLDRSAFARGPRKDAHSILMLVGTIWKQTAISDWILAHARGGGTPRMMSADSAALATARIYSQNVRIIESLARTYSFSAVYVWQPTIHGTQKILTPFEQTIRTSIGNNPFQHRLQDVYVAIPPILDSLMPPIAPGRFVDATSLFRGDSTDVFMDRIGHNSEASVPRIVDAFWPVLHSVFVSQLASRTRDATPAAPRPRG